MIRSNVVLPTPLDPMSPVNSPLWTSNETSSRMVRPEKEIPTLSTVRTGTGRNVGHRCSVEVRWATAASMAATSATIQDW